jgi:hypothetical protein
MWVTSVIFKKAQSKKSPIGRKFSQSDHPGADLYVDGVKNLTRVARFFWAQYTKTAENIPTCH